MYVVDPDEGIRNAVRNLVFTMNLRCEAFASGQEFLDHFTPCRHGCLVLAVRIPDINGLEIQSRLNAARAPLPVVFLSEHGTVSIAVRAMRDGALHFLEKPFREHELWDAIEEALLVDQKRRAAHACRSWIQTKFAELSDREQQILELFATGSAKEAIAAAIDVSVRTVELRLRKIMTKLGATSQPDLMRLAMLAGNGHDLAACPFRCLAADADVKSDVKSDVVRPGPLGQAAPL